MKELEQLQKAKSTLKEILKVHMREPINDNEFQTLFGNMKRLRKNGCELIWSLTQNFKHYSVWNFEMLKMQLEKKKFEKVVKQKFREGENKNILLDREQRKHETLYVEAKKI